VGRHGPVPAVSQPSGPAPQSLRARAYAKVNLGLEVLRCRDDGYHEIRTILQTVDFYDRMSFGSAPSGIHLTVVGGDLPEGPQNLVHRAAVLLAEASGCREGAFIHLEKHIPAGAGLGGGSADAAMTLLALDRLWRLGTPPADLHALASRLGMDVPFFLYGGTALAAGRGDEIYPLALEIDLPIVLILPDFSITTASAYANLRLTNKDTSLTLQHFAWSTPSVFTTLGELVNDLEGATGENSLSIREFKQTLLEQGALISMMSGSGSSVYGIFHDEASAQKAERFLMLRGSRAIATRTLDVAAYRAKRLMPFSPDSSDNADSEAAEAAEAAEGAEKEGDD
jgi:4-diphosphocytidyl-2-C-methyl-D-erythritol kinase